MLAARRRKKRRQQVLEATTRPESLRERRQTRLRWLVLVGLLGLFWALVTTRLLWLQTLEAPALHKKMAVYRGHAPSLYHRGRILDRHGVVLAQDSTRFDLYYHPTEAQQVVLRQRGESLPDYFDRVSHTVAEALSGSLPADAGKPTTGAKQQLFEQLRAPQKTVTLAHNLSADSKQRIQALRLRVPKLHPKYKTPVFDEKGQPLTEAVRIPGLDWAAKPHRNYPQGGLAAHLLGYVNDGANMAAGVEHTAKGTLRAWPFVQWEHQARPMMTARGDWFRPDAIRPETLAKVPKSADVRLTLDARLQHVAEQALAKGLVRSKAMRGSVIILHPRTGEVLAFAVSPAYWPEAFYKAPPETLKNWAITDTYPPGSTIKILTVGCGLETGVITPHSHIQDTGWMRLAGWRIANYDYGKHGAPGNIDLVYLLQHSSNIGSAKISLMMPAARHRELLLALGFGRKTGIELTGESPGDVLRLPRWDTLTHATLGYGYGLQATPLQMAAAVNTVANGGVWVSPRILRHTPIAPPRRVFSPQTASALTHILVQSIDAPKQSTVRLDGYELAGKTGTSRKPNAQGTGYTNDVYTSFVGYFPARHPEALIMVVIDSPKMGEAWGSTVAGPIFKEIAEETIRYLDIKPNRPR
jgi:cell division protein FtsI (penicillin-binding protein 3)